MYIGELLCSGLARSVQSLLPWDIPWHDPSHAVFFIAFYLCPSALKVWCVVVMALVVILCIGLHHFFSACKICKSLQIIEIRIVPILENKKRFHCSGIKCRKYICLCSKIFLSYQIWKNVTNISNSTCQNINFLLKQLFSSMH